MSENRTRLVLRESAIGLVYRLGAVFASFIMMPVMLRQLGAPTLGVWLVLLSVFQWITFFDLGVASGARNEIARAVAEGNTPKARSAITTGWYYTWLITFCLGSIIALILGVLPVTEWLKTRVFGGINPGPALWVVSLGACFSFALNYIQIVFAAHQKASVQSSFSLLSNFLFLGFIYFFPNKNPDGLLRMSLLYLAAMLIANSWLIVRFFSKRQNLLPSPKWIDSTLRKRILGFGLRLFIIQLAAMIIFTTARLMVSLFVNPAEVVIYDAAFKVFSLVMMVHGLLMTTLWSSFTHAYTQQDWPWIHRTLRRLILLMVPVILGCTVLAVISPRLIGWWLGSKQVGGSMLYFLFAVMVVLSCWSNIFSYFLNGIGKIHLQFYSAIIAAAINLPLSYLFAVSFGLGISGVVFGTIASSTIFSVLGPWYVLTYLRKIHFNDTAR